MNISILGCGWLGIPLAKQLIKLGYLVKGSTRKKLKVEKLKVEGILPYVIDLKRLDNRLDAFLCSEILIIAITDKNIEHYNNLISYIENSSISKVLFISSTSVYDANNSIVNEESPLNNSPLVEIESLFKSNQNFETTVLRFSGLLGYDRKPGNFFAKHSMIKNPEAFVNMIHQDDCIAIIESIIIHSIWGISLNAATDTHPTRREFYTQEILKVRKEKPIFDENSTGSFKLIDSSLLKATLEYEFIHKDLLSLK